MSLNDVFALRAPILSLKSRALASTSSRDSEWEIFCDEFHTYEPEF